ncbi:hypothetical protein D3C76_792080 [compost metagenome]
MAGVAQLEALVHLRVQRPQLFLVLRVAGAVAQAAGAEAFLEGFLADLAILMAQLPLHLVGQRAADLEAVVQADALAVGAVGGQRTVDGAGDVAEHVGVGVVGVALVGQLYTVAFLVVPADLGQQVVGVEVHRVGVFAGRADAAAAAEGFGFVAAAAADGEQAVDRAAAAGEGRAAQPGFVGAVEAGLEAGVDVVAVSQVVGRVLGDEAHRAADGVAAVQRAGRAAEDLDALHGVEVDVVAARVEERAEGEGGGHADAVDLGQYAVAVDAADVEAGQAEAAPRAADRHARLVAHQILDVVRVGAVDVLFRLHGHGAGDGVDRLLGAGGGDRGFPQGNRVVRQDQRGTQQQQAQPVAAGERRSDRHEGTLCFLGSGKWPVF